MKEMVILACEKSGNRALIDRARKMEPCGRRLLYALTLDGEFVLDSALFCRQRLCPVCQWRRSLKCWQVMKAATEQLGGDFGYQLLTLSRPNVPRSELREEIGRLNKAFRALMQNGRVKSALHGYYRALEVSYNPERDDFHPHFHVITAVKPSYYHSRYFIKRDDLVDIWNSCNGHDRETAGFDLSLDWRRVRDVDHDISEVAKYCSKPLSGYADRDDAWGALINQLNMINEDLAGRRLIQTGGVIRDAIREAGLLHDLESGEIDGGGLTPDAMVYERMGFRFDNGEYHRYF